MTQPLRDLDDVSAFKLSEQGRARLFGLTSECIVCWTNSDGWPVGMPHSFVWSDGKFWVHTTSKRARLQRGARRVRRAAVRRPATERQARRVRRQRNLMIDRSERATGAETSHRIRSGFEVWTAERTGLASCRKRADASVATWAAVVRLRSGSHHRSLGMICLRRQRSWPSGNAGRPAFELHDIANPQLPPAPGLRLAVHQDLAGRNQFLGL
jgi:hypothetical protein